MFEISGRGKQLLSRPVGKNTTKMKPDRNRNKAIRLPSIISPKKSTKTIVNSTIPRKKVDTETPLINIEPSVRQMSVVEEAEKLLAEVEDPALQGTGFVTIRFNHYNKPFPIHNGVLKWSCVDEEYCISFVYRGNFRRDLKQELSGDHRNVRVSETACRRDENGIYFLGLVTTNAKTAIDSTSSDLPVRVTYRLDLEEDPVAGVGAEGLRLRQGPIVQTAVLLTSSSSNNNGQLQSGNKAVNDITTSLLKMKTSELNSQEANDLRERRDLEDILFS
jgi:hypothetical protein